MVIGNYPTTSEVNVLLNGKVDKIDGKQLSKNDFTDALKSKLENDVLTEHQSLVNYIQKSQTEGFVRNDGSIDTNEYLTEHQSLTNYIQKSQTEGFVRNDGSIDTNEYLTEHQSLTNYVQKSQVSGLIKNDGTIDANQYLTEHQSLTNYVQKSLTSGLVKNDGTIDTNKYLTKETALKPPNYGYIDSNLILHLEYLGTEISATKTIIQTGENSTITVVVTDEKGNLLENKPVEFYINGTKVGETINTNSNGVASYTYQGSGSGEIEVQVKIGSIVSVPCNVIDAERMDSGIEGTSTNLFSPMSSNTFIRGTDGTEVTYNNTGGSSQWQTAFTQPVYYNGNGYAVEMEVVESTYQKFQIATYETGKSNNYDGIDITEIQGTGKFKWIYQADGKVYWYKDGNLIRTTNTVNTERFSFFIQCPVNKILDFKYKNFVVYPI